MKSQFKVSEFMNFCNKIAEENYQINVENCFICESSKVQDLTPYKITTKFVGVIVTMNDYDCSEYAADFINRENENCIYNFFKLTK